MKFREKLVKANRSVPPMAKKPSRAELKAIVERRQADPLASLLLAAGVTATPTKAADEFDRMEAARSLGVGPAKAKQLLDAAVARGTLTVRECRVVGSRNVVLCWRRA